MAQSNSLPPIPTFDRRDRPWLFPSNHKLRNIVSISLRKISFDTTSPSRKRGQTNDDDALPQALQTPTKTVALREQQRVLSYSRSSTDLRAADKDAAVNGDGEAEPKPRFDMNSPAASPQKQRTQGGAAKTPPRRTDVGRIRRRSTLEWVNATPQRRQERLEDGVHKRMADVFFTLHVIGIEEPVYVSEMVQKTLNPTFRHVDWSACGPGLTRQDRLILRVWVKGWTAESWKQLLELKIFLTELQYLGKTLEEIDRPLSPNAVLFHLTDGIYVPFTDSISGSKSSSPGLSPPSLQASSQRTLPTSSFNALLRLSKLDDSIQDALTTRNKIASYLEDLLQSNKDALSEHDQLEEAEDRLKTIEYAKKTVGKQLEKARKQQAEKRASLIARRKTMSADLAARKAAYQDISTIRPELPGMGDEHTVKTKAIQNQRRRICEDLQRCYPIQPDPGKTLSFTIRGLHIPNSEDLDSEPPDVVSAALGYVSSMLQLLSFYLSRPLPYPVTPCGSRSLVHDPISILKTKNLPVNSSSTEQTLRAYPLFSKGVPRFRFEYAVFLLNQDIHILLESAFDVRVVDNRHTLPNLKYLLYVATAGEGELPARKAGGVRGLLRARPPALPNMASTDSESSVLSGSTLQENGRSFGAVESLKRLGAKKK